MLPAWARALSLGLAVFLVAKLFLAGGDPSNAGLFPEPWDKLMHFCFYGAVAGLLLVATGMRWPVLVWIAVVAVGVLDEWVQRSESWRSSDPLDLAVDALAALVAVTLYRALVLRRSGLR